MTKIRLVPLEKLCDHSKSYYSTFITPLNFNGNWKIFQIICVQTLTSRSNASLMYKARSSSYRLFPLCTASLFLMGTISVLIAIIDVSHSFQNIFMLNMAIQQEKLIENFMPPWTKLLVIVLYLTQWIPFVILILLIFNHFRWIGDTHFIIHR